MIADLAPTGRLRAAINVGNPILANRSCDGDVGGVSVDLARTLAAELGVAADLVVVDRAADSVAAVRAGTADVGFFALDPARSQGITFTAAYVLIEGAYAVRTTSPVRSVAEVDAPGHVVAVGAGSAYDLFLTRELRSARIHRVPGAPAVLEALRAGEADVAAGIGPVLAGWVEQDAELRAVPGRFMVIEQAMGMHSDRGGAAHATLAAFVERMKATGTVRDSLHAHRVVGAVVAPAHRDS